MLQWGPTPLIGAQLSNRASSSLRQRINRDFQGLSTKLLQNQALGRKQGVSHACLSIWLVFHRRSLVEVLGVTVNSCAVIWHLAHTDRSPSDPWQNALKEIFTLWLEMRPSEGERQCSTEHELGPTDWYLLLLPWVVLESVRLSEINPF